MSASEMSRLRGRMLRTTVSSQGRLILSLDEMSIPELDADEIVVRVEAAPLNPADLLLLFGPADPANVVRDSEALPTTSWAPVPDDRLRAVAARLDQPFVAGNEGAGLVVRTGSAVSGLLGRTVAFRDQSYADYRRLRADECLVLPEGLSARDGASAAINPMTALGMVETLKREGHPALVHTAAASNVGQMLVRLCLKDGIPLVNIVRSQAQVDILRGLGAEHVVDSSRADFPEQLVACLHATGATLAFDAIGGGTMAATLLSAMEEMLVARLPRYSRYGSSVHKQVYVYGVLDPSPRILQGNFGMAWGVAGWLMSFFYQRLEPEAVERLRTRVLNELTTTFASRYTAEISLEQALDPAVIRQYARRATGEKYLIVPSSRARS